jgi:hypothetical protein
VGAQVGAQVRDQVGDQDLEFFLWGYGDLYDLGWLAFYDYFDQLHLKILNSPRFDNYRKYGSQGFCFLNIMLRGFCICSRMPVEIHRDGAEIPRLHSESGPAIRFADNISYYFVHGVLFKFDEYTSFFPKRDMITIAQILAVKNTEQRAALLQCYGLDKLLETAVDLKILDKGYEYAIKLKRRVPIQLVEFRFEGMHTALVLHDHSTEKRYVELVPREMTTIHDALQWQYHGHDPEEFVYAT